MGGIGIVLLSPFATLRPLETESQCSCHFPPQRLLAKRAEKKDAGVAVAKAAKPVDDGFDMFG